MGKPKTYLNFGLAKYIKSETNLLIIQQHFAEIRSLTSEYSDSRSIVFDYHLPVRSSVQRLMHVIFTWIPSDIGFHGNTVVDQQAKDELDNTISNCWIPYTCSDFKPFIMKYILKRWQHSWDEQIHNKLHELHSLVGKTPCSNGQIRKKN